MGRFGARFVVMLVAVAGAGCGDSGQGAPRPWLLGEDRGATAPACARDDEALTELLVRPQSCTISADCPTGSHCDQERGACDWLCLADSDCGGQDVCSCDGLCIGPDAVPPPGDSPIDPTCPRSEAVLGGLNSAACGCGFDEDCPFGAHCDAAAGECRVECVPSSGCAEGLVCDCSGRCVAGDAEVIRDLPSLPRLDLSPSAIVVQRPRVEQPGWQAVEILAALVSTHPEGASQPLVHVRGGPGLAVSCDGGGTYGAACDLTTWSYEAIPQGSRAANVVLVIPTADCGDPAASPCVEAIAGAPWEVRFSSSGIADLHRTVTVGISPASAISSPLEFDGEYEGVVELEPPSGGVADDGALDPLALQLPVTAWVRNGSVLIFDPSNTLSGVGKIEFSLSDTAAVSAFRWIEGESIGSTPGVMEAQVRLVQALLSIAGSGVIRGTFGIEWPFADAFRSARWRYTLHRVADLEATTCVYSGCQDGQTCAAGVGLCAPGPEWRAFPRGPMTTLLLPAFGSWSGAEWRLEQNATAFIDLYIDDIYLRRLVGAPQRQIGSEFLPSDLGFELCERDFMAWLATRPLPDELCPDNGGAQGGCVLTLENLILPSAPPAGQTCSDVSGTVCEKIFARRSCSGGLDLPEGFSRRDEMIPCVVGDLSGNSANRVKCSTLFGKTNLPQAEFDDWLDLHCTKADVELWSLGDGGDPNVAQMSEIHLCLFKNALFGSTEAAVDQRLLCFDPTRTGDHPLESTEFGEGLLATSGDAYCRDSVYLQGRGSLFPHGVDLYSHKDAAAAGEVVGLSGARLLEECLKDLREDPPSLPLMTEANAPGQLETFFALKSCFSAARLFPALYWAASADLPRGSQQLAGKDRLFMRMLQQWVGLHAFVARQGRQEDRLARVISAGVSGEGAGAEAAAGLPEIMEQLDRGWDLLLEPRIHSALAAVAREDLFDPDYRLAPAAGRSDDEQPVPMFVSVIEGLSAYLEAQAALLEQAAPQVYGQCYQNGTSVSRDAALSRLGLTMRYALAVEALATQLHDRAAPTIAGVCMTDGQCQDVVPTATCQNPRPICLQPPGGGGYICFTVGSCGYPPPDWGDRWSQAQQEFEAVRARVMSQALALVRCENPLGIPEEDLPLFFGDLTGTNARFFASSDYVLSAWAGPAVETSRAAFERAREAWLARRSDEIQEQATDSRLDQLKAQYGRPIVEMCGITDMEAKDVLASFGGAVDIADRCYRVYDAPGCAGTSPMGSAECFRGELGEAALSVFGARLDVEDAGARWEAASEEFQRQMDWCQRLAEHGDYNQELRAGHSRQMQALRAAKAQADQIANALDTVGEFLTNPVGAVISYPLQASSIEYGRTLAEEEAAFADVMAQRSEEIQVEACYVQAKSYRSGITLAALQIKRAASTVEVALLRMRNLQGRARQQLAEGNAVIAREETRSTVSVAHHYWLDERVARFEREFSWARRLTYLAMRAVEYEYQQSLPLRDEILAATHPDQLEDAVRELQREQAARTISRRRPEETTIVRSLRDDILRLEDRGGMAAALDEAGGCSVRGLVPESRFEGRLWSDKYRVYDSTGATYLGQGIPFTVSPEAELTLRCAERMWRVTATVQGDLVSIAAPQVPLVLLKRNTFYSQWCGENGDGTDFQVGSVSPSAQLFRPGGSGGSEGSAQAFSSALMYPWFNVRRSDFYKDQYEEGASEELAGRGLYGEYVLLFPWAGLLEDGFELDRVEDVLIPSYSRSPLVRPA